MGEAKRRAAARAVTQMLTDQGRLIAGGWAAYALLTGRSAEDAAAREAYFAGAIFLFDAGTEMLEPGHKETASDMRRMEAIALELVEFEKVLLAKYGRPY
jgi:hypothetical protein